MHKEILNSTAHRDFSYPKGPWVMTQKWNDLLFMHLSVSKSTIREKLPAGLELDTYDDIAWISILPFKITNMRFRKTPPIPFVNSFLELNVRTYVKRNGVPGIYFFSLDAENLPAVLGARVATLPYYLASMKMKKGKDTIHFSSTRSLSSKANFEASYKPKSEVYYPEKHSLEHWLVERYYLWSYRNKSLYEGGIHHKPWQISNVEASVIKQEMLPDLQNDTIKGEPIFHYAKSKRVLFWIIKKVGPSVSP